MDQNEVDGKRKMIQVLMGVLKKSAGDEVSNGIGGSSQHKELTHTPVPSGSVADHPHKKETFKAGAPKANEPKADLESTEPNLASQVMPGMKEGGMVDLSEPNRRLMQPASDDMRMSKGGEVPPGEDDISKMADGGMPSPTDEPEEVMNAEGEHSNPEPVKAEDDNDDIEGNDTEDNEEEYGNDYTDPFAGVMSRKKKK